MTAARQPERRHPRGVGRAWPDVPLIQRLLEQGARAFLTRPLDVKELLELLDAVAAERQEAIATGQARTS
jgi:FixJ family two-component response regulator